MVKNSNSFETEFIMLFMSGPQKPNLGRKCDRKFFFMRIIYFLVRKVHQLEISVIDTN